MAQVIWCLFPKIIILFFELLLQAQTILLGEIKIVFALLQKNNDFYILIAEEFSFDPN